MPSSRPAQNNIPPSQNSIAKPPTAFFTLEQIQAEQQRRDVIKAQARLSDFFRLGWHVLEPTTPLTWNWHIDAICDHVQAALEDWMAVQVARMAEEPDPPQRIHNLLINVPPGTAKSRIVSVYAPAWMWLKWPSWRGIFFSTALNVVLRDSMLCRQLIESEWYRDWFKPDWELAADQNAKSLFNNTAGGFRMAITAGSKIVGNRADALFVDDPNDADDVKSAAIRMSVNDWWDLAAANRVNDLQTSLRVGIMQRLHEMDWSGHVLSKMFWTHLIIQQEYEAAVSCKCQHCEAGVNPIGYEDPRTEPGELLMPKRFPKNILEDEERRLGAEGYAGQHQQRPAPAEGAIFKAKWWRFWVPRGISTEPYALRLDDGTIVECIVCEIPESFEELIQSWDMAFKETKKSDYVCGQVWGRVQASAFLLDQVHGRMDFVKSVQAVRDLSVRWPAATRKLIEEKANGAAIISSLQQEVAGLIPVIPDGGKEPRAYAVTPVIESGNVYLPHPDHCSWVGGLLAEAKTFPNGQNDDRIDTLTQALKRLLVSAYAAAYGAQHSATKLEQAQPAPEMVVTPSGDDSVVIRPQTNMRPGRHY